MVAAMVEDVVGVGVTAAGVMVVGEDQYGHVLPTRATTGCLTSSREWNVEHLLCINFFSYVLHYV